LTPIPDGGPAGDHPGRAEVYALRHSDHGYDDDTIALFATEKAAKESAKLSGKGWYVIAHDLKTEPEKFTREWR
jgi:hypothetical protein